MNAARVTAQVACEYIANHGDDGWDVETVRAVLETARAEGVAQLYVAMAEAALVRLEAQL